MFGKKGMSPLIATILLMAFAVALGGMIMNWSSGLPDGGIDCSDVKLQIKTFCLEEGKIKLSIRNVGEKDVAEIRLLVLDPPIKEEKTILDSAMSNGASLNVEIPFSSSASSTVGIIPALVVDGDPVMCPEPVHQIEGLPEC